MDRRAARPSRGAGPGCGGAARVDGIDGGLAGSGAVAPIGADDVQARHASLAPGAGQQRRRHYFGGPPIAARLSLLIRRRRFTARTCRCDGPADSGQGPDAVGGGARRAADAVAGADTSLPVSPSRCAALNQWLASARTSHRQVLPPQARLEHAPRAAVRPEFGHPPVPTAPGSDHAIR